MSYNPYRKYCWSWWAYWRHLPKDCLRFLLRLWAYTPILWEDRDWDHAYLLRLIQFKIRRMRRTMDVEYHGVHGADRVAEMARAEVLIRNVVDEDPADEWSAHYYRWDMNTKAFKECKNPRDHKRALRLSWKRQERNWRTLWRHLERYTQGWWD